MAKRPTYRDLLAHLTEVCMAVEDPCKIRFLRVCPHEGATPNRRPDWGNLPSPHSEVDDILRQETGMWEDYDSPSHPRKMFERMFGDASGWRCGALPCQFPDWWPERFVMNNLSKQETMFIPADRIHVFEVDVAGLFLMPQQVIYSTEQARPVYVIKL